MYHIPPAYEDLRKEYLLRALYNMAALDSDLSDTNYYRELYHKIAKLDSVKKVPKQKVNLERFL